MQRKTDRRALDSKGTNAASTETDPREIPKDPLLGNEFPHVNVKEMIIKKLQASVIDGDEMVAYFSYSYKPPVTHCGSSKDTALILLENSPHSPHNQNKVP